MQIKFNYSLKIGTGFLVYIYIYRVEIFLCLHDKVHYVNYPLLCIQLYLFNVHIVDFFYYLT